MLKSRNIFGLLLFGCLAQWGCGSNSSPSSPSSPPAYTYPFFFSIGDYGTAGSGNGQFNYPAQIAVYNNTLFVADAVNARVMKFDLNGNYLQQAPVTGTSAQPIGLAVDHNGVVYVSDQYNGVIRKYDTNLDPLGTFTPAAFSLNNQGGLAVDSSNRIYIADTDNQRILRCTNNGSACTAAGSSGSTAGHFGLPFGIAIDGAGNVYVADTGNSQVQKFDPNLANPSIIVSAGVSLGQVLGPQAIAVDSQGNLLVSDATSIGRVQKFTTSGTFITSLSHPPMGNFGPGGGAGIAFDSSNNTYISDINESNIDVYRPF
jgi:tripartite motif-containing protein 71